MNINLIRLKPVIKELRAINTTLSRLADCWETELAQSGIYMRPTAPDPSKLEPTVSYVDEEEDYVRELQDADARLHGKLVDPVE